jgi:chromosome segregation protein
MNKGARYFKCDFQVHTPRDLQFTGQQYVSDGDRKTYSEKFIKSCREKKIDAVAITDHHDLYFYKYIQQASLDEVDSEGNQFLNTNELSYSLAWN